MFLRQTPQRRALITGGAGFVGSHLAEALLADGYSVAALDDLSTGRLENLAGIESDSRFSLIVGNVMDEALTDELVAEADVVFHLAAAVGVKLILADPIGSIRTNVLGTETVLRAAERHGRKVLIASTSEVYGKTARLPQREDDDVLLGPTSLERWSYACCKMLDEFLGLSHARLGLPVVCFRLFNTVGPRQTGTYGMVVPRFVDAALRGDRLDVHGDGTQSRCFLHVRDAVAAIVRLAHSSKAVGHVFNVGSTESVTILELAQRALDAAHLHLHGEPGTNGTYADRIRFVPYSEAYPNAGFEDIRARQPDVSRLRSATRWRPRRSLDDILRDVVEHRAAAVTAPEMTAAEAPVAALA